MRILIGFFAAALAFAAAADENAVKYRQHTMDAVGGHMQALAEIVKGEVDHKDHLPVHVASLAALSGIAPDLFGADSREGGDTDALPKIWEDPAAFKERLTAFRTAATDLDAVVKSGRHDEVPARIRRAGQGMQGLSRRLQEENDRRLRGQASQPAVEPDQSNAAAPIAVAAARDQDAARSAGRRRAGVHGASIARSDRDASRTSRARRRAVTSDQHDPVHARVNRRREIDAGGAQIMYERSVGVDVVAREESRTGLHEHTEEHRQRHRGAGCGVRGRLRRDGRANAATPRRAGAILVHAHVASAPQRPTQTRNSSKPMIVTPVAMCRSIRSRSSTSPVTSETPMQAGESPMPQPMRPVPGQTESGAAAMTRRESTSGGALRSCGAVRRDATRPSARR